MNRKFNLILLLVIFSSILFCALLGFTASSFLLELAKRTFDNPSDQLERSQIILYSLRLFLNYRDLIEPIDTSQTTVEFKIKLDETAFDVAIRLKETGLIRDSTAFLDFLVYAGIDRSLQAGNYQLTGSMNAVEIAQAFIDPTPEDVDFIILPGLRAEEIAALLPTSGLMIPAEEFLDLINNPQGLHLPDVFSQVDSLEGLLLPGKYEVRRDVIVQDFLQQILDALEAQFTLAVINAFEKQGLDPYQALILASIVQREAVIGEESSTIASVFLNRLDVGMQLQSDPTVQYAIGYDQRTESWWKTPLTPSDMQINSLHNTYVNYGLPPTPICSVDLSTLTSVAFPAEKNYYYFHSGCDESGTHIFSETYEQHQSSSCQ
ncbi:MAG TPA: endolytic transglycosylase MltG [Anaerolineae bacterium]|nr:endolytic transglycosylase MltG [Anaerolineae bacterium]